MIRLDLISNFEKSIEEHPEGGCIYAITIFFIALIFLVAVAAFSWWVEMSIWNNIIASVFELPKLTFWQIAGIDIFIGFLFPRSTTGGNNNNA